MKASAILLSWQRPENLPPIVDALRAAGPIGEVLIWNNNPDVPLAVEGARVVAAPENMLLLPRLALALLARYPVIWYQDDDLLLTSDQVRKLVSSFARRPHWIHGAQGRCLTADGRYDATNVFGQVDIVNQAQVLHHTHVSRALARLPSPLWRAGIIDEAEDDILLCLAQGRRCCLAVDCGPLERRGASDPVAWSKRPDHWARRQRMVDWMLAR